LQSSLNFVCVGATMFGESQSFSQTLSFGFGNSTQSSPQKKTRQEGDKQSCLPVTAKMVCDAIENSSGGDVHIHGEEVSMVLMVGVVESLVKQTATIEFILNDATRRIKVRQYVTDSNPCADAILPGVYVSVVGNVRTAPEPHLSAQFVSAVDSPDQVSYHMIESVHAMLKLTRKTEPMTPAPKRPVATPQTLTRPPIPTSMAVDSLSPQKEMKIDVPLPVVSGGKLTGDALRSSLLAYLREQGSSHPEGIKLEVVSKSLEPTSASDVKLCLEMLVSEGEVFNTIDDAHFSTL